MMRIFNVDYLLMKLIKGVELLSINEVSTLNPVNLSRVVNWMTLLLGDSVLSLSAIEPSTSRLAGKNTCSTSMHHRN